jgi:Ca2+:H+ antiporter
MKDFLTSSKLLILLVFVPCSIFFGAFEADLNLVFVCSMLAILPLAMLLSNATEVLANEAGEVIGALLNATFGNAVEMIVSTVALTCGEITVVQSSMLGAILSNILLCLGTCLFIGGWRHDCHFDATAASTMASLMVVASASLVIPAALNLAFPEHHSGEDVLKSILGLSRGTAVILLVLYIIYLNFQLETHSKLFEEPHDDHHHEVNHEEGVLSPAVATLALFGISMLIAMCAEHLVGSIDSIVETFSVNRTFIGLIVLPVVGNAAEYVSAMRAAARGKMSLALGVAVGSSMQVALFVTPALVILGWILGQNMSLSFEPFGSIAFFLSVLVVEGLIAVSQTPGSPNPYCLVSQKIASEESQEELTPQTLSYLQRLSVLSNANSGHRMEIRIT